MKADVAAFRSFLDLVSFPEVFDQLDGWCCHAEDLRVVFSLARVGHIMRAKALGVLGLRR
jgi:hypothetical protein